LNYNYLNRPLPVFILLFLCISQLKAQDNKILHGHISTDSLPANNIHIINITTKQGTTSDDAGEFSLTATINDSVLFSSVQFQNRTIRVSEEIFNSGSLEIKLYPANNELDEVRISDLHLSGVLFGDVPKIKIIDRAQFGIPYPTEPISQTERHLYTATHSAGGVPLDLIINTINGKIKMLKKVKANDDLTVSVEKGMAVMGRDFFTNDLGLPEEEVLNFLYFCAYQSAYQRILKSGNELDLMLFLKNQKQEFFERRSLEG